jgi:hypothetical protein
MRFVDAVRYMIKLNALVQQMWVKARQHLPTMNNESRASSLLASHNFFCFIHTLSLIII